MTDRYPKGALQRRQGAVATRPSGGSAIARPRPTAAVYDTVTEGMTGWRFVITRRWIVYILCALVFAAACVVLSRWQLDRGRQADRYNATVSHNFGAAASPIDQVLPKLTTYHGGIEWARFSATGSYETAKQLYVRNRGCGDDAGFEVLTPFKVDNGNTLIVDRGCVTAQASDPNYPKPAAAPPSGTVSLIARVVPGEPQRGGTPSVKNQVESIALPQIAKIIGVHRVYTGSYGMLASQTPAAATSLHKVVSGVPTVGTAIHWSYMIQWVLFALIGFWGLWYGLRSEFRRINADDPEERERAWKRLQREASKKFTDGEIEDEILDGHINLARWGFAGNVAINPSARAGRQTALGYTRALDASGADAASEADAPLSAAPPEPEVYVLWPAGQGPDAARPAGPAADPAEVPAEASAPSGTPSDDTAPDEATVPDSDTAPDSDTETGATSP